MNLEDLITRVAIELPGYEWLIRNGGRYDNDTEGEFFAHVFDPRQGYGGPEGGYLVSHYVYDVSPVMALEQAVEMAVKAAPFAPAEGG